MKKIIALLIVLSLATGSKAQNATKGRDGNYIATERTDTSKVTATGNTFTDRDGVVYPVFETAKGKLFYTRTSKKTGKPYKAYLKL